MKHYYRITTIMFNAQRNLIEKIIATPTSYDQSLFFPPVTISRQEVIAKIKSGDDFFITNQEAKRMSIQIFLVDGKTFLKTSNKPLQKDFIEFLPESIQK